MPTVAVEGQFRFVVNTRENSFEPPHVHVWVGNEDVCRIELNGGAFMEAPPPRQLPGHHECVCEIRRRDQKDVGQDSWRLASGRHGAGEECQSDDDGGQPAGGRDRVELLRTAARDSYRSTTSPRSRNVPRYPASHCRTPTRWSLKPCEASGSRFPGTSAVTTVTQRTVRRSRRWRCGEGRLLANASASSGSPRG